MLRASFGFQVPAALLGALVAGYSLFQISAPLQNLPAAERLWPALFANREKHLLEQGYDQMFSDKPNPEFPVHLFRQVLAGDFASGDRWCDLAGAFQLADQPESAEYCFLRGVELGPNSARILLNVLDFYSSTSQYRKTLRYGQRILALIPDQSHDAAVFNYYSALKLDPEDVIREGVPDSQRPVQAYFRHLLKTTDVIGVGKVWNYAKSRSYTNDLLLQQYLRFLVSHRQYDRAQEVWSEAVRSIPNAYQDSSRLFNGDFELPPAGGPFDWTIEPVEHVEVARVSDVVHSGKWSLRMQFDGGVNLDYHHVAVAFRAWPGQYRFEAFVKSAGLTTDRGIGFKIFDRENPGRLSVETATITGSVDWRKIEQSVVIGPETKLIEIQLIRRRSWKFDNAIQGTAWIDAVKFVQAR